MVKLIFSDQFFNIKDTLSCGQTFRFKPFKKGYIVNSSNKCCYCYNEDSSAIIECEDADRDYFYYYFDLDRDYKTIYESALSENVEILSLSAMLGKGIRILNQDSVEMLFSFIVSQNNNIPRIKGIIEKLCLLLGEKKCFYGQEYYAFPTIEKMAEQDLSFYQSIGLGYRAEYIRRLAVDLMSGMSISAFNKLSATELKSQLIKIHGVGPKVADCVALFGFHKSDSFPVDTWIEKVYREDFKGSIKDRAKISEWFTQRFKQNSGYYQQYLFYYKRISEKTN